jgi:hypothetical protein
LYGKVVEPVMLIDELKAVIANSTAADVAGK